MSNNDELYRIVVPALVEWDEAADRDEPEAAAVLRDLGLGGGGGLTISASADVSEDPLPVRRQRRGQTIQVRFAVEAMERNYAVAVPYWQNESYDVIVIPPRKAGECKRRVKFVQVRSSLTPRMHGPGKKAVAFHISLLHGSDHRPYRREDFDVLAAYVAPHKAWYIIPICEVEGLPSILLYPHREKSPSRFEKFRDRWDLLD